VSDIFDRLIDSTLSRKNADVQELLRDGKLYDRVVTEVSPASRGRKVMIDGRWVIDFASCNYLGLDLREEVMAAIPVEVKRFGTHPSWARLAASPVLYEILEDKLAQLCGAEDALVLPTITLIAIGLIPAIAGKGSVIFADKQVHKVNHDGCRLAREMGAQLESFSHDDLGMLERKLAERRDATTRLIVVDGVLSVTGRVPDLTRIAAIARAHDALLYIDDAHGFGVLGEDPSEAHPFGRRGNGVVRHLGIPYDNVLYVSGLSKAYSSLCAFVLCPKKLKSYLKCTITSYIVSGPVPTAALATALAGLALNEAEGDAWRTTLFRHTRTLIDGYRAQGIRTDNDNGFPIVSAWVGSGEAVKRGGQLLDEEGIYVTLQGYPLVPRDKGVLRATPTVANSDDEVATLIATMARVQDRLRSERLM
jgi:8-amino-7-oxononanoate synthase